jgi:hypothetical protein
MKPDRYAGLRTNEAGVDAATGETVLVTNCICSLPHKDTETYTDTHDEGCLMVPYEGLVFTLDAAGDVVTWRMQDIRGRQLTSAAAGVTAKLQTQMAAILEADRKRQKAENFRGRR